MKDAQLLNLLRAVYMERVAKDIYSILSKMKQDLPGETLPESIVELYYLARRIESDAQTIRDNVSK